ncbi:unnamed protein product [Hymenolepis diminuta]|uniref:Histone acetyltransferase n=1 Tax=Hymenolepis diminuta TaxID=6216 RepID=A0A0R3S973_HYMDI|nr:unnamed protein product [Hymenolepis diminuta]
MSGSGSDGQQQQQIHLGAPQQMQHPQMQPQMHTQMRPQAVIRQTTPVHMQQGQNIVRMQRPQVVNSGQKDNVVSAASPVFGLANGGPRVIMPAGGQMGQPVHVLQQGVMQSQSQGIPNDGGHNMSVGMVDQTRPIGTNYGPQGTTHMQSVPMYPIGGPGVQQPFYGQQVRISGPGGVQQQMTGNTQVRLIPNANNAGGTMSSLFGPIQAGAKGTQFIQQQQMGHPQQPQQQHFMPAADGQQQRMMVSQPRAVVGGGQGMKIIPTSQQQAMISQGPNVNIQTVVRSNMSQPQMPVNQPQQQQVGSENTLNVAQMQNPPQMIKPEQQQNFLQILDNAMKQLSQKHPETDLKKYTTLRNAIMTGQIHQKNLSTVEKVIHQLKSDPSYLLKKQNQGGSGEIVSEEMRQKLLAQKRSMQGTRPTSSSSLNTLLSQPVDHPGAPVGAQYNAPNIAARQPQQITLATAELLNENPVDDFNGAMDKIVEDIIILKRKMGPVRAAQIDNEVCEMARKTLEKSGHLLSRDVLPVPKSDRGPYFNTGNMVIGGAERLAELKEIRAAKKPKYEEWPILTSEEDQLVCNGKRVSDIDLTIDDLNPRLNAELEEMRKNIEEVEITIVHPEAKEELKHQRELGEYPDMEEMNKHDKVHDATEWNNSLHLLLNFSSKNLPCGVPPLYVSIPPAYLITKNVVWMYRPSDFDAPQLLSDSIYSEREIACFRRSSFTLIRQFLGTYRILRRKAREPISLYNLSEIWVECVLKSILTFREFPA